MYVCLSVLLLTLWAKQNNNVLVKKLRNLPIYIPVVRFFINLRVFVRKIQISYLYQFFFRLFLQ